MMKRDQYLLIAGAVRAMPNPASQEQIIGALVTAFTHDNPAFIASKFRDACGAAVASASQRTYQVRDIAPQALAPVPVVSDAQEPDLSPCECPVCGALNCTDGDCGWSKEEIAATSARLREGWKDKKF